MSNRSIDPGQELSQGQRIAADVVGAVIAVVPIPGFLFVGCFAAGGIIECCGAKKAPPEVFWIASAAAGFGKIAAIAVLITLVAIGIIANPVGIGLAITACCVLGGCLLLLGGFDVLVMIGEDKAKQQAQDRLAR